MLRQEGAPVIGKHFETNEPLPTILRSWSAAQNFARNWYLRHFAMTDLELHARYKPGAGTDAIFATERKIAEKTMIMPPSMRTGSCAVLGTSSRGYAGITPTSGRRFSPRTRSARSRRPAWTMRRRWRRRGGGSRIRWRSAAARAPRRGSPGFGAEPAVDAQPRHNGCARRGGVSACVRVRGVGCVCVCDSFGFERV